MHKEIFRLIKKYDSIVISRHVGADVDALGSQLGLKKVIENTFPNKKVYAVGAYSSKFKFMGSLDKEENIDYKNSLLIVLDTPIIKRIDIDDISLFAYKIKIDHHPFEEKFCDIELIDENKSSTCEMIIDLCNNTKLKLDKDSAEKLYMGVVADTNRFMYPCTSPTTMILCANLIKDYNLDISELYPKMYMRNINEIRFIGYVFDNIKVTKNGVGYISITDKIQKEYMVDPASAGNMVSELTNILELLTWVTFSEDKKMDMVRVSIRSRGPIINELAMEYNGGGHKLASGIRLKNFDNVDEIVTKLDKICKKYKEDENAK